MTHLTAMLDREALSGDHTAPFTPVSKDRGERGTAFVVALLVLVVLTIAGLALTLMTQTEVRIGANEREANRTFYASDSGIQVSTAMTLYRKNNKTLTVFLNTTQQDTNSSSAPPLTFGDQIVLQPLFPLHTQPCSFCQINQNLQNKYAYTTHLVNITTTRLGTLGSTSQTLSQKVVAAMIGLQPIQQSDSIVYNPPPKGSLKY
jgi:Tfp pilus assembly protein PilX